MDQSAKSADRSVFVFSQRAIIPDVSRCSGFEFEDVVAELENAVLGVPRQKKSDFWKFRGRRWLSKRTSAFTRMPSGVRLGPLDKTYDLFGCFVQKPVELLALDAVPNWRERSRLAVCVIEEIWDATIKDFGPLIKSLEKFDLITCAFHDFCEPLSEITGRPVLHLPGAADMTRFAPSDLARPRPIDVYYMGRKRPDLHSALQQNLGSRDSFYLYDSAAGTFPVESHSAHRVLFSDLVKRSKLFVVDYAKIGHSDQVNGIATWGPRHVEGMAGGAVQVGYTPDSVDYNAHFDWPESVVRLPEVPEQAAQTVAALLDDPAELDRRRRINLAQALGKHDWLHRWALILEHFQLGYSDIMLERDRHLAAMAEACRQR